jgi:ubiquinone/menaquinone biosynthesis C-methylase UbiE
LPDNTSAASGGAPAFEAHAADYDARTALSPGVGESVANAIVRLGQVSEDSHVLEIGAGTGEIGGHLAHLAPGYLGIDNSPAMLEIFRAKVAPAAPSLLIADADLTWPVPDASTQVVFASRVIHLLDPEHVAQETQRVCRPDGYFMVGRVNRDPDSVKERLRRRRQHLLRDAGIQPRQGEPGAREIIDRLEEAGWTDLGRQVVAAWTGEVSPGQILAGWEPLSRMGSVEVARGARMRILEDLRAWAAHEFGDLDRRWPYREQYMLDIAARSGAAARQDA